MEKLFARLLFNYVFSNGDAHLKNFSLFASEKGDYVLTPAYDLLCTAMHFPTESRTALDLFDDYESPFFSDNGFYGAEDFLHLAERYGIRKTRAERLVCNFAAHRKPVESIIERSFLSDAGKNEYRRRFIDRLGAIN